MPKYVINDRRLRRFLRAEKVCQALREHITAPGSSTAGLGHAHVLLVKWMRLAPSSVAYGDSTKPVPKKP